MLVKGVPAVLTNQTWLVAYKNRGCILKQKQKIRYHVKPHYSDVIMGTVVSQITSPTIVYLTVYSGADQRKHQSSASLAFVRGVYRWPVNSCKWPVTRKIFSFDDVIMHFLLATILSYRFHALNMVIWCQLISTESLLYLTPYRTIYPWIFFNDAMHRQVLKSDFDV